MGSSQAGELEDEVDDGLGVVQIEYRDLQFGVRRIAGDGDDIGIFRAE